MATASPPASSHRRERVVTLIIAPALVLSLTAGGGFLLGLAYDGGGAAAPTDSNIKTSGPAVLAQSANFVGGPSSSSNGSGNFSVTGDYATVNDTIDTFRLVVQGTTAWENLPGDPSHIKLWLSVEPPDAPRRSLTTETVANETIPIDTARGTEPFTLTADVLTESSWNAEHFAPPVGGTVVRSFPVFLSVQVVWTDASGDKLSVSGGGTDRLSITVAHASQGEPSQTTDARGTSEVE